MSLIIFIGLFIFIRILSWLSTLGVFRSLAITLAKTNDSFAFIIFDIFHTKLDCYKMHFVNAKIQQSSEKLCITGNPFLKEEFTKNVSAQNTVGFPEEEKWNQHKKQHHHPRNDTPHLRARAGFQNGRRTLSGPPSADEFFCYAKRQYKKAKANSFVYSRYDQRSFMKPGTNTKSVSYHQNFRHHPRTDQGVTILSEVNTIVG
jgi:hypothetical protein